MHTWPAMRLPHSHVMHTYLNIWPSHNRHANMSHGHVMYNCPAIWSLHIRHAHLSTRMVLWALLMYTPPTIWFSYRGHEHLSGYVILSRLSHAHLCSTYGSLVFSLAPVHPFGPLALVLHPSLIWFSYTFCYSQLFTHMSLRHLFYSHLSTCIVLLHVIHTCPLMSHC